ncbi:MAG: T9SS type A sorting domain-containing protein, partial [Chlorobi bacterium]|nr:T9SS type A sorting domain-containing protein [Chlorobiota bacterium]
ITGNLTINSDATGTGSLVDKGTITVGGTSTVELYLPANRWWYVTPPVTSSSSTVFDANSTTHKLYWWNETNTGTHGWIAIATTGVALNNVMQGFACKYTDAAKTLQFTGTIVTGEQTRSVSYSADAPNYNGFNLVGNPYPSALDWGLNGNTWTSQTNVRTSIWYRKDGSFATYNSAGGTSTNGGQRYIPAMQAFWVKVDAGTGTLTPNNASRVHSSQAFYKSNNAILKLIVNRGEYFDETVIGFFEKATNTFDSYDTEKWFAVDENYPQLYTNINDKKLAVNGLSPFNENLVIPLGFKTEVNGKFTIKASDFENIDAGINIYLEDLKHGNLVDLGNTAYTFYSEPVNNNNRFILHIIESGTTNIVNTNNENLRIYSYGTNIYINDNEKISGTVIIYDMLGKIILTKNIQNENNVEFSISSPTGFYLVKILRKNRIQTKRIFIGN